MLEPYEQDLVLGLLIRRASLTESPRQSLVVGLDSRLAAKFPSGSPTELADRALKLCMDDGYQIAPPAIVGLLRLIEDLDGLIPHIIARVHQPPPATPDVFDAVVLDTKQSFLARNSTRSNLRALLDQKPYRPVVAINGPRGMGKSHTSAFIEHVLRQHTDIQHCIVPLAKDQSLDIGARELASDLITLMGGNPRTLAPQCTNGDRWAQELANDVISEGVKSGEIWWIVLDGFNGPSLRVDTKLFITKLAASLMSGIAQKRFRLVLLDFDTSTLTIPPVKIADETTGTISAIAVSRCIEELTRDSPENERKLILEKVLDGLGDPIKDLTSLGSRLGEVIRVKENRA